MKIDVFTLFPNWFDWFREQRHVRNAFAEGHELGLVDLRATTPIANARVDDTPYGGRAGMVIRVDVVEAALAARYGGAGRVARSRGAGDPLVRGPCASARVAPRAVPCAGRARRAPFERPSLGRRCRASLPLPSARRARVAHAPFLCDERCNRQPRTCAV